MSALSGSYQHLRLKHLLFLILGFILPFISDGQVDTLFVTNSKSIDDSRYKDIKGSPYLFTDWVTADIMRRDSFRFRDVLLNYNGDTREFEVVQDGKYIELQQLWYRRIEIDPAKNEGTLSDYDGEIVFLQGFHPSYIDRFALLAFEGQKIKLIKDFSAVLSEKTVQNVGKAVVFKRFSHRIKYYLLYNDKLTPVKLKQDDFWDVLGFKEESQDFLKSKKIKKINSEKSARLLLEFIDKKMTESAGDT